MCVVSCCRRVAVICSYLQCVLQCVAVCCRVLQCIAAWCSMLQCVAVCRSVLQYVIVCCSVCCIGLICVAVSIAVTCKVLQSATCVAVCSRVQCLLQ